MIIKMSYYCDNCGKYIGESDYDVCYSKDNPHDLNRVQLCTNCFYNYYGGRCY